MSDTVMLAQQLGQRSACYGRDLTCPFATGVQKLAWWQGYYRGLGFSLNGPQSGNWEEISHKIKIGRP